MEAQEAWNAAVRQLEMILDRASFDTWVRPTQFLHYNAPEKTFFIGAPNTYARDMLQFRLYRNVQRVLSDLFGSDVDLSFELSRREKSAAPAEMEEMPLFRLLAQQEPEAANTEAPTTLGPVARVPELPEGDLNPRYIFDRFITNRSNQMVHEAARAVAEFPATVYNPLTIYGGVGLGKTHILQAIAHACTRRKLRTIYVPSEVFMNDLIYAIRQRTTAMFREKYRSVDVLLVDDVQFIAGKETTQEEFFHTFNALVAFNKQIVLASDRHPRELTQLEDRLRSRFQGGLVADVQPPELETRMAILHMWAQERSVAVSEDVIAMVAQRAPASIREMEGVFNQIVAQMRLHGSNGVSMARAEATLDRFHRPRERYTLEQIIDLVARKQGLTVDELVGKKRTEKINRARQIAMFIVREMTEYSLPQIGEAFGGRSHTTVLHGCNKIAEEVEADPVLAARIQSLRQSLTRHS